MNLKNNLKLVDFFLALAVAGLLIIRTGKWADFFAGMTVATLIIAIIYHIGHFKLYKKFY